MVINTCLFISGTKNLKDKSVLLALEHSKQSETRVNNLEEE